MNFIKPIVNAYMATDLIGGLKLAEFGGRLCYKSEGKQDASSYKNFLISRIAQGHTSILEHCPIYITSTEDINKIIYKIAYSPYSKRFVKYREESDEDIIYIYSNLRVVCDVDKKLAISLINTSSKYGNEIWKKYNAEWFVPDNTDNNLRVSAYITTQRSIIDELVRERVMSPSVESTRFCNYNKHNSDNTHVNYCIPHWIDNDIFEICKSDFTNEIKNKDLPEDSIERLRVIADIVYNKYQSTIHIDYKRCWHYIYACITDEILYKEASDVLNLKPEDAREYLFLGVKSETFYSGFMCDWKRIIDKRCYGSVGRPHPNMKNIMDMIVTHIECVTASNTTK